VADKTPLLEIGWILFGQLDDTNTGRHFPGPRGLARLLTTDIS
jgi:hypothetical protein